MKRDILKLLSTVQDPDLKQDLISLNMIENLEIDKKDRTISFKIIFTTPLCPLKDKIKSDCLLALDSYLSKNWKIIIHEGFIVKQSLKKDNSNLSNVKNIIAIISGKGGVGKSTLCTNIAYNLAHEGARVGILDGDLFGPSILDILGIPNKKIETVELVDKKLLKPITYSNLKIISIAPLTDPSQAIVWRGPLASKILKQLLFESNWEELDYLFIDLPPGTSDLHITTLQNFFIDATIFITTPHELSLADVSRSIEMQKNNFPSVGILGIIENMAFWEHPITKEIFFPFGKNGAKKVSLKYNIPILSQTPLLNHTSNNIADTFLKYKCTTQVIMQTLSVLQHS